MDPNANLQEQAELIQELTEYADNPDHPAVDNALTDLALLRVALRQWLNRGGFEPDWTLAPNAAKYYGKGKV